MLVLEYEEGEYFGIDVSVKALMRAVSLDVVLVVDEHLLKILDEILLAGLLTLVKVFEHQLF